ncbi:hypothetical protein K438DRAFT_1765951 [Mycena galopus ATCC 62051]|nr:hypothetical protein K438DRAFT_1765951 [Mycena galopus ATCC 62051]
MLWLLHHGIAASAGALFFLAVTIFSMLIFDLYGFLAGALNASPPPARRHRARRWSPNTSRTPATLHTVPMKILFLFLSIYTLVLDLCVMETLSTQRSLLTNLAAVMLCALYGSVVLVVFLVVWLVAGMKRFVAAVVTPALRSGWPASLPIFRVEGNQKKSKVDVDAATVL